MEAQRDKVDYVLAWDKICKLPKLLWREMGIAYTSSLIGKPYKMDELTATRKRTTFARVCVRIAANQKLLTKVPIRVGSRVINLEVEYGKVPLSCQFCSRFGHATNNCLAKKT